MEIFRFSFYRFLFTDDYEIPRLPRLCVIAGFPPLTVAPISGRSDSLSIEPYKYRFQIGMFLTLLT